MNVGFNSLNYEWRNFDDYFENVAVFPIGIANGEHLSINVNYLNQTRRNFYV